jgi:hypothetical protein
MISILTAMAIATTVEPTSRQGVCSVNDSAVVPCVVVYNTDLATGTAGLAFVFDENQNAVFVGTKQGTQINVVIAGVNFQDPVEVDNGVCISRDNVVGCTATVDGQTLKVVAAFQ